MSRGWRARAPGRQPTASQPDHDEDAAVPGRELDSVAPAEVPATGTQDRSMAAVQVGPAAPASLARPDQGQTARRCPSLPALPPPDLAPERQQFAGEVARGIASSSPLGRLRSVERAIRDSIGRDVCRAVWASMVLRAGTSCPVQRAEVFETVACILRRTGALASHEAYLAMVQRLGQGHTPASRAALRSALESWLPLPEEGELIEPSPAAAAGEVADILLEVAPAELPSFVAEASLLRADALFMEILRHLAALTSPAERSELAGALAVGAASPPRAAAGEAAVAAADGATSQISAPPDRVEGPAVLADLAPVGGAASPQKRRRLSPLPAGPVVRRLSQGPSACSPTHATRTFTRSRVDAPALATTEPVSVHPPLVEVEGQDVPRRRPEEDRPGQGRTAALRDVGQGQTAPGTSRGLQTQLLRAVDAGDNIGALATCRLFRLRRSWPSRMNHQMCALLARSRDASLAVAYCQLFPNGFQPRSPSEGKFMADLLLEDGTFAGLELADQLAMMLENRARQQDSMSVWRLDVSWYSRFEATRNLLARREADANTSAEADRFLASLDG